MSMDLILYEFQINTIIEDRESYRVTVSLTGHQSWYVLQTAEHEIADAIECSYCA